MGSGGVILLWLPAWLYGKLRESSLASHRVTCTGDIAQWCPSHSYGRQRSQNYPGQAHGWLGKTCQDFQQGQPSHMASASEDLRCWGAWGTNCRHKAKGITPLIIWRRRAQEEKMLDNLPWKEKKAPLSNKHWNCFELIEGKARDTFERWSGLHMSFPKSVEL